MGLSGLSLAWHRAEGPWAATLSLGIGAAAALVFALVLLFSLVRAVRHPQAVHEDWQHPVRHAFLQRLPSR